MLYLYPQTEHSANVSLSSVRLTAERRVHGQRLSCRAENDLFPDHPLTDSLLLNVTCKCNIIFFCCRVQYKYKIFYILIRGVQCLHNTYSLLSRVQCLYDIYFLLSRVQCLHNTYSLLSRVQCLYDIYFLLSRVQC